MLFKDRKDAGRQLAIAIQKLSLKKSLIIALPRGGVAVAAEVAHQLQFPLDIIIPRKIGAPFNPELAIGALLENEILLDEPLIASFNIDRAQIESEIEKEKKEAKRRLLLYRQGKPPQDFRGKTIVVVDDGIATGATMRVSVRYLQKQKAQRIIIAVPVAPLEIIQDFRKEGFEVICLYTPSTFDAVGQFYENFAQTTDEQVLELLRNC